MSIENIIWYSLGVESSRVGSWCIWFTTRKSQCFRLSKGTQSVWFDGIQHDIWSISQIRHFFHSVFSLFFRELLFFCWRLLSNIFACSFSSNFHHAVPFHWIRHFSLYWKTVPRHQHQPYCANQQHRAQIVRIKWCLIEMKFVKQENMHLE